MTTSARMTVHCFFILAFLVCSVEAGVRNRTNRRVKGVNEASAAEIAARILYGKKDGAFGGSSKGGSGEGDVVTFSTKSCIDRGIGDCFVVGTNNYPSFCGYDNITDYDTETECTAFCLASRQCIGSSFDSTRTTCYLLVDDGDSFEADEDCPAGYTYDGKGEKFDDKKDSLIGNGDAAYGTCFECSYFPITVAPTTTESAVPSASPSAQATTTNFAPIPSQSPSAKDSAAPSAADSASPTTVSSNVPSSGPVSMEPSLTAMSSVSPTAMDSAVPSSSDSAAPSPGPTFDPTDGPTMTPSMSPTVVTTTNNGAPLPSQTESPVSAPSASPSAEPTNSPSYRPTSSPSSSPVAAPSPPPTVQTSSAPSIVGSSEPSRIPSRSPINSPTLPSSASPVVESSSAPTVAASSTPSVIGSSVPTAAVSSAPSVAASSAPSIVASSAPSLAASSVPSLAASSAPSIAASSAPSIAASSAPSVTASVDPTTEPSMSPTIAPTKSPSSSPTTAPPTGVIMMPPDGSPCWERANDATLEDLIKFLNDPTFDTTMPRVYTFCPGSVVNIGYLGPGTGFLPFSLVGDNLPIIPINPYMHIRCGDSGLSSNNCTFRGGQEQILTQSDRVLMSGLLPFLPFLVPGLPAIPALPDDYTPDSSNFVVEGFTFESSAGFEQDEFDHATVAFIGPGKDMVIKDCIFRNNVINGEATAVAHSAVYMARVPAAQIGTGVYASLTILDTVFEGNDFEDGVVVTGYNGTATENSDPSLIELTVKDCTFSNNLVSGPDSTLAVIRADLHTTLSVEDSCFTSNTITGDGTLVDASIVSSNDGIASYKNLYGTSNTLPVGSTCPEIAQYTLNGALTSITSTSCSVFDAATCVA